MTKFKKIEINENQPLDDVIKELENRGLHLSSRQTLDKAHNTTFIGIFNGWFELFRIPHDIWDGDLTTLTELKNME